MTMKKRESAEERSDPRSDPLVKRYKMQRKNESVRVLCNAPVIGVALENLFSNVDRA